MAARVLIVDPTEVMRAMMRLALEDAGFEVVAEATGAAEAKALFREKLPDVLTLDLSLPDGSGLDVARELRAERPGLRFVVVTSQSREELIREAVEMGAKDFVVKPFQPGRFVEAVRKAVA